jgi:TolB-like protein
MDAPIVAIVRFDNETGDSQLDRFTADLTDTLVEQMTSEGHARYSVIGNAQILRGTREQRDLNAIAATVNASYVVIGQVQSNASQVRILAHLIRLPDQTHVWVVRADRALRNPLDTESEVAQEIAREFSSHLADDFASKRITSRHN